MGRERESVGNGNFSSTIMLSWLTVSSGKRSSKSLVRYSRLGTTKVARRSADRTGASS